MTMHKYLLPPAAEEFIAKNLTAVGIPYEDAYLVATLMIQSDLAGADGHGIFRLPAYITVSYTHLTLPTKRIV